MTQCVIIENSFGSFWMSKERTKELSEKFRFAYSRWTLALKRVVHFFFTAAVLLTSCVTFVGYSNVANAADFHSPRTAALGGAGHAGPVLNDAIYQNPAFSSFLPMYSAAVGYGLIMGDGPHPLYNASFQDGRSEIFQAGVGYTRQANRQFFNLGASRAILQRLGFGMGAKFFFLENQDIYQDASISMMAIPVGWIQVAFVADNIFEGETGLRNGLYREFVLGTKFNMLGIAMFYADPHFAPNYVKEDRRWGYEFGIEVTLMSDLFIRAGHYVNAHQPFLNDRATGASLGIGWMAPKLSLDYGYSRPYKDTTAFAHIFGCTIYF